MPVFLIILMLYAAFPTLSEAEDAPLVAAQRDGLALTVYDSGFTLVEDSRRTRLEEGQMRVAFESVSPRMVPASAFLVAPANVAVANIVYDFNVLTPQTLLQHSVGREVDIVRSHPTTGEDTFEPARLLSVENGIVLSYRDRIETNVPGRLAFRSVPENLRTQPALIAKLQSDNAAETTLVLSYLTEGLDWRADYVIEIGDKPERLSIVGRALITNTAGIDFADVQMSLIAGTVRRERDAQPRALQARAATMAEAAPMPMGQSFADVHLYAVPGPVALNDRQTSQITLLQSTDVPVRRDYLSENSVSPLRLRSAPALSHPDVRYRFTNVEADGLGIPLPAGIVRMYRRDEQGGLRLIGEDRLSHTSKGQEISLTPSEAFDVTVARKQLEFTQVGGRDSGISESAWQIDIQNAKDTDATVTLVEVMPTPWTMLEESAPHEKQSAQRVEWRLNVPANGESQLTYRVRLGS